MDYGKSFSFIFKDDNWISKFLIGVVVSIIPIINFAAFGYILQLVKDVRDGRAEGLPEWDEFGKFFFDGLKFFLGTLVYALPVIILSMFVAFFSAVGGEDPGALVGLSIFAFSCLMMLFALVPSVLLPALAIQYIRNDEIRDMFAFSEMWEMIQADLGNYLIILLLLFAVTTFVASIGFIVCFIGVFFTSWYAYLVSGHLIGQYAAELPGKEKQPS